MPHDPTKPPTSYREFVAVTHPVDIMGRVNSEHWTGRLYLRHISPLFSMPLVRTRVTPNMITGWFIIVGWCIGPALLIPGIWGPITMVLVSQLHGLIDCMDGEVARWKEQYSPAGPFLDSLGHFSAEGLIPVFLGLRAAGVCYGGPCAVGEAAPNLLWAVLGAATGMVVVYKKSISQLVQVSRAKAGLEIMKDSSELRELPKGRLRTLRRIAQCFPIQRINHSVESTLLALIAGIVGLYVGDALAFRWYVAILLPLTVLFCLGLFIQAMASGKLRK
ncbi:MAG: CDP-alcohol phosphatidyltransferase family protein [Propionibacteriaceae bacterium]|jgi:phosphatidylglycerophosphate synthase|nr:CDP-alcohol phosphatidyltransferase family protein [Propionibacteriaceae bacterium]